MSSTTLKTASRSSRDKLHSYQERAVSFSKGNPNCALWIDMGLGKTVTVLTAISNLIEQFEAGAILIISPLRVANITWPDEIRTWDHTRHLSFKVFKGSPRNRLEIIENDSSRIHIINRELVPWLVDTLQENKIHWPYDMVVIDESSSFKFPSALRFKKLRRMLPKITRMVQLSGTPASNGLLDVWSQIFL